LKELRRAVLDVEEGTGVLLVELDQILLVLVQQRLEGLEGQVEL